MADMLIVRGRNTWALIMQREDLHLSSTTDMPIVGRLKMSELEPK